MTITSTQTGLSPQQQETFLREGYLVVEDLFTDADLQPVIGEINEEVTRRAGEAVSAGELSSVFAEAGFERQLTLISRETDKVARSIWNGILCGPAIFNLIRHPKLLDVAESLCGPELIASSVYRLRPKIPHYGFGAVPWHQDSGYFEPYCDKALVLTVWLPLVDATPENGCLEVIPRKHQGEVAAHTTHAPTGYLVIREDAMPQGPSVLAPVRKGGALLLTNRTPHASGLNTTDIVRWSMDLRYQSAALPTNAAIPRLDGESVPSPERGVPVACYPPEADFLVRSRLRPHAVVTDPAEFQRLRTTHQARPVTDRWRLTDTPFWNVRGQ
ncbi:MAG: phytanoyl-CoA dioxygenase family protein [Candidatus Hydrogenedentes bacterium]|nr:phytanoyl-CoA dioxygenase family protein [Candidatus Hydrogenedentota bacterium]